MLFVPCVNHVLDHGYQIGTSIVLRTQGSKVSKLYQAMTVAPCVRNLRIHNICGTVRVRNLRIHNICGTVCVRRIHNICGTVCEELEDTQYLWHRVWGTWGYTIFVAPCVWGTWGYIIFVAPCVWGTWGYTIFVAPCVRGGYTIFVAPCVRGTWGYTISYNPHFVLPISPTDSRHRSRTESVVFSSWYIEIVMHSHTCSFGTIPLFRDLSNLQFWISCRLPYPLPYLESFLLATDQKPRAGMAWEQGWCWTSFHLTWVYK